MSVAFLVSVLVFFIFAVVVVWAANRLMTVWGVEVKIATTIYVLLVLILVLIGLSYFGMIPAGYFHR